MKKYKNESLSQYIKDIEQYHILSYKEAQELIFSYKCGNEDAKDKLIQGNLNRIIKIAGNYTSDEEELLELISIGNLRLLEYIDEYDLSNKCLFINSATTVIYKKMNSYMESKSSNKEDYVTFNDVERYVDNGKERYRNIVNNVTYNYDEDITLKKVEEAILKEEVLEILKLTKKPFFETADIDNKKYLTQVQFDIIMDLYGLNGNEKSAIELAKNRHQSRSYINSVRDVAFAKLRRFKVLEELCKDMDIGIANTNIKANVKLLEKKK
ncbi:MAG: hypothetical protein ACI4OT_01510 [Bacilli bacterium]